MDACTSRNQPEALIVRGRRPLHQPPTRLVVDLDEAQA
jgi:hypothetical protein